MVLLFIYEYNCYFIYRDILNESFVVPTMKVGAELLAGKFFKYYGPSMTYAVCEIVIIFITVLFWCTQMFGFETIFIFSKIWFADAFQMLTTIY